MDTENKENIENKENVDSSKVKKERKKFEVKNLRMNVSETYEKVQSSSVVPSPLPSRHSCPADL